MFRRNYPIVGATLALMLWMAVDCQSQTTPPDLFSTPASPTPNIDDLTPEQKALLEFLQNDGMAALICYGGYVIVPTSNVVPPVVVIPPPTGVLPPPTGGGVLPPPDVIVPPPTNVIDPPPDNSGEPIDPIDPPIDPPDEPPLEESPEPGSIVLGLVGLGVTSLAYVRRRRKECAN